MPNYLCDIFIYIKDAPATYRIPDNRIAGRGPKGNGPGLRILAHAGFYCTEWPPELCSKVSPLWTSHDNGLEVTQQIRWVYLAAFSVTCLSVWDSLSEVLRDPGVGKDSFTRLLKTFLFATYWCILRITGFTVMCYISLLFTYLLNTRDMVLMCVQSSEATCWLVMCVEMSRRLSHTSTLHSTSSLSVSSLVCLFISWYWCYHVFVNMN